MGSLAWEPPRGVGGCGSECVQFNGGWLSIFKKKKHYVTLQWPLRAYLPSKGAGVRGHTSPLPGHSSTGVGRRGGWYSGG